MLTFSLGQRPGSGQLVFVYGESITRGRDRGVNGGVNKSVNRAKAKKKEREREKASYRALENNRR
jgi:hypothetical protein